MTEEHHTGKNENNNGGQKDGCSQEECAAEGLDCLDCVKTVLADLMKEKEELMASVERIGGLMDGMRSREMMAKEDAERKEKDIVGLATRLEILFKSTNIINEHVMAMIDYLDVEVGYTEGEKPVFRPRGKGDIN